jgi:hypothetical protein
MAVRPRFGLDWPLSYDETIDVPLASPFLRYALLSAATWFGAATLLEVANGVSALKPLALTGIAALQLGVLFSQGLDDWPRRRAVAPA